MKTSFKKYIFIIFIIIIYSVFLYITSIGCPIRYITHFPCPMCGTTRALIFALMGDFSSAFHYHPLFLLAIPFFILLITIDEDYALFLKRETRLKLFFFIVILYILVYFIRLSFFTIP